MSDILAELQKTIRGLEALFPVVWYASTPYQKRGMVAKVPAGKDFPEYYVFNDEDFKEQQGRYAVRWRNIRSFPSSHIEINVEMRHEAAEFVHFDFFRRWIV